MSSIKNFKSSKKLSENGQRIKEIVLKEFEEYKKRNETNKAIQNLYLHEDEITEDSYEHDGEKHKSVSFSFYFRIGIGWGVEFDVLKDKEGMELIKDGINEIGESLKDKLDEFAEPMW